MSIDFYKEFGELGYLANYSNHGFYKDGIYYKTVEHYYQASKFSDPVIRDKIINAKTPKEASCIGRDRNNIRIPNFRKKKLTVMYLGILEKFRQNSDIRSKLIETRNQEIREMSVKENFWGVGPLLDGRNEVGKILMMVRSQVREEVLSNIIREAKGKKVYIIGHSNPDCDSVFSSYLLSKILKSFGVDAVFAVRDENFYEKELILDYLDYDYEVVSNYEDKSFILVDTNSLDGIDKKNVIGSIDHHIITHQVDNLIEAEYASCGLLIYDLFKEKYNFNYKEKMLILLTVLCDTDYLTSSRFSEDDKILYDELGLNVDVKELQKKYFKTTDFSLEVEDNIKSNYKEYNYNGIIIKRSIISSYSREKEKYFNNYVFEVEKGSINLLIWCDYESLTTYVFYKGREFVFPYFTSSTNLIIKYLEKEKIL